MSERYGKGIVLPLSLPFSFPGNGSGKITLPITLPFSFRAKEEGARIRIDIPVQETHRARTEYRSANVPMQETGTGKVGQIPSTEIAWDFEGFIIEETVIDKFNSSFTIIDEVRNRIFTTIEMIDANNIYVHWTCAQQLPGVDVLRKTFVDEEYTVVSSHKWSEGKAKLSIAGSAYQVLLQGHDGSGESYVLEIEDAVPIEIRAITSISLNEKSFDIPVNYTRDFKFEVNL